MLEHILQPHLYPDLYGNMHHVVRINYYPPRGDNKEGWDNIDIFGWLGYPMQIKVDFLCRDSILAAPIVLDLALFMDLAQRCGMSGIQEWLSFYWKSPMTRPGLYPEHDLFIQLMKLKNTLRHLGRRADHAPRRRVLRLGLLGSAPRRCARFGSPWGRRRTGSSSALASELGIPSAANDHERPPTLRPRSSPSPAARALNLGSASQTVARTSMETLMMT